MAYTCGGDVGRGCSPYATLSYLSSERAWICESSFFATATADRIS
jgi:hypothetical protein